MSASTGAEAAGASRRRGRARKRRTAGSSRRSGCAARSSPCPRGRARAAQDRDEPQTEHQGQPLELGSLQPPARDQHAAQGHRGEQRQRAQPRAGCDRAPSRSRRAGSSRAVCTRRSESAHWPIQSVPRPPWATTSGTSARPAPMTATAIIAGSRRGPHRVTCARTAPRWIAPGAPYGSLLAARNRRAAPAAAVPPEQPGRRRSSATAARAPSSTPTARAPAATAVPWARRK